MWGSTTPNTNTLCYWGNAPFNNGSDSYNEEYFTTHKSEWLDDKDNLKPEFDAARAIMGGDWRMPTKSEFQEFLDNTTELRVLNYNGTGVNGRKFTSKTDTSKYIFIPDAGYRESNLLQLQNSQSFVWSSSLDASSLYYAWCLNNYSDYVDNYRYYGMSVRGVRK